MAAQPLCHKAAEPSEGFDLCNCRDQWPRAVRTLLSGVDEPFANALNAFLFCRDALLARMDEKDLRITLGLFLGERQADVALDLGITQPSVARRQMENGANAIYQAHLAAHEMTP